MTKKKLDLRMIFRRQMLWRNMNQSDIAKIIGVSRQQVSMYFRGECGLNHDSVEKLLEYFDLVKEPEAPKERPLRLYM